MVHRLTITAACCLLAAVVCLPGAEDPDPQAVLKRAIAKVIAAGKSMPNFTCVETVTRQTFHTAASTLPRDCPRVLEQRSHPTLDMRLHLFSTDRLRLDVTMAKSGEIFSWAGASKFDDSGLENLVRQGPIGTGAFGAFLLAVFRNDSVHFYFARSLTENGRKLLEYSYQVALADSHYRVKTTLDTWVHTAYSGIFRIDPATDDVVHLAVRTDELPEATGSCLSTSVLDFAKVPIGLSEFMLASHMSQHWVARDGSESENSTAFTGCREYTGESTVTFLAEGETGSGVPGKSSAATSVKPIPDGLRFALVLAAPLPTDTAAAGDLFRATLADALRDGKSKVLAPKGSMVEGRLLRVESFEKPPQVFVAMRPRTVEVNGVKVPVAATLDWQTAVIANRDALRKRVEFYLPRQGEERSGVFRFLGQHIVIPKGFRSEWRTVDVPPGGPGL